MKFIKAQLFTLAFAVMGSALAADHNNINELFTPQSYVAGTYTCGTPPSQTANDNQAWCACQFNYMSARCEYLDGDAFCRVDKALRYFINVKLYGVDIFCRVHYPTKAAQCSARLSYYMKSCPLQN